jgi:MATE family multidrug resistance protein
MRTPLVITVIVNVLNIGLDYVLIFGPGRLPAFGVAGAATASVISQWIGAALCVVAVHRTVGFASSLKARDALRLLKIGGDLFIRTGLLTLFLLVSTRVATRIGAHSGAAHQAIRQAWMFSALSLDALAITGQSLVGFFLGGGSVKLARSVAARVCGWSLIVGALLTMGMILTTDVAAALLVPRPAYASFVVPWIIAAVMQPLSALSFATDGIHWGTGDFRYLRNGMIIATGVGLTLLLLIDVNSPRALELVWWSTSAWILARAIIGVVRIWPAPCAAPLARRKVSQ